MSRYNDLQYWVADLAIKALMYTQKINNTLLGKSFVFCVAGGTQKQVIPNPKYNQWKQWNISIPDSF